MSYLEARNDARRIKAIGTVVVLHALLIYALINGLARSVIEVIREPIEAKIIEEMKAPPPPEPPSTPQPRVEAPPIPTVPPPEVPVPVAPPVETITVAQVVAPPAPPAPAAPAAPAVTAPAHTSAGIESQGCVRPEYPPASLRAQEAGTVSLAFLVGTDGAVLESRIDKSTGYRRLDEAARRALGRCKFRPAYSDGKPQQAWAHIEYEWRLE